MAGWVHRALPVILVLVTGAFAIVAGFVLMLVAAHTEELLKSVGTVATIQFAIGSLGLFISAIGVLIAALRYSSERNTR